MFTTPRPQQHHPFGFTLAELLISLAILGVIATFTIPKLIQSQQNQKFKAIGKEFASMVTGAYDAYKKDNTVTASTKIGDLTPYMNFVAVDTASTIDATPGGGALGCSFVGSVCLVLHSGARVRVMLNDYFGGTGSIYMLPFQLDPDGIYSGTFTGPGKMSYFYLYANGRIVTSRDVTPSSCSSGSCVWNPNPGADPDWFSW